MKIWACCAIGCTSRSNEVDASNKSEITFHRFPRDRILRKKWIKAVKRHPKWVPSRQDVLCSLHFTDDCFRVLATKLRVRSVPTIFSEFDSLLQQPLEDDYSEEEEEEDKVKQELSNQSPETELSLKNLFAKELTFPLITVRRVKNDTIEPPPVPKVLKQYGPSKRRREAKTYVDCKKEPND